MVLLSLEQYSVLTDNIEQKLDETDISAEQSTVRYGSSEVFSRARSRINEKEKI